MAKKKVALAHPIRQKKTLRHRIGRPPEVKARRQGNPSNPAKLAVVPSLAALAQAGDDEDTDSVAPGDGNGNGNAAARGRGRPAGEPYEKITVVLSLSAVVKLDRFLVDLREKGKVASRADVIRRLVLEVDLAEMAQAVWGIEL